MTSSRLSAARAQRFWLGLALLALLVLPFPAGAMELQGGLRRGVHTLTADAATLRLAHDAGFDTVVQLFSWRQIEPTRGEYHWQYPDEVVQGAAYYGMDLVVRLDQHPAWAADAPLSTNAPPRDVADYARFVRAVASRYRGRVLAYVIWNEPNLAGEWGGAAPDPAAYVVLLKAAYQAVKEADPYALVVSAGLASTNEQSATAMDDRAYLEAMYQAGAKGYFDVLGAHPYGFAYPPDDLNGAHQGLNMARLADLHDIMVAHGDGARPIWATEMGWTVSASGPSAWQAVSEQEQAAYLTEAFTLAPQQWPWLGLLSVWNLDSVAGGAWDGYNLLDDSGRPRPAYRDLQALFGPPASTAASQANPTGGRQGDGTAGVRYQALAPDSIIHLGHRDYSAPWVPLYGAHNPSTVWEGTVYVGDARGGPWHLTMRIMQSNSPGNLLWLNGQRLDPAFPPEDFSNSWVSYTWDVPAGIVQPGPNQVKVTIGQALPLVQDWPFNWDDLQFKDVILWCGDQLTDSSQP